MAKLETEDLLVLRAAHEGLFIDCIAEPSSMQVYAKAVSAMANTKGGWIFIGAKEVSRSDNRARVFPGIGFFAQFS